MTDEELIAKLRMIHEWKIGKEAADRIEALAKANVMLEGLAGLASIGVDGHGAAVELAKRMAKRALDAEARIEALTAENERLEARLGEYNLLWQAYDGDLSQMRVDAVETKLAQAVCFQIAEDVFVEKRGKDRWCVRAFGNTVVDRDLNRQYEPMPSSRTDEFVAATRFTLEEAFDIAQRYNQVD